MPWREGKRVLPRANNLTSSEVIGKQPKISETQWHQLFCNGPKYRRRIFEVQHLTCFVETFSDRVRHLGSPLQGFNLFGSLVPGRWPGLWLNRAVGAKSSPKGASQPEPWVKPPLLFQLFQALKGRPKMSPASHSKRPAFKQGFYRAHLTSNIEERYGLSTLGN
jgi:hypothetical protein